MNFGRVQVSRKGRFHASFGTTNGTQQIGLLSGHFTSHRRAVFYVRRIETPPGLPACDSGPVRFVAKFMI
ncbi:MAG: hypothetical protein M3Z33_03425 [Actinomycetota bacterium]|nr:hypothetical protein [Actinomycetota bacterium]